MPGSNSKGATVQDTIRLQSDVENLREQIAGSQRIIAQLQRQLSRLEDIEQIKKLQRCYGYYFEHGMNAEVAELFADTPEARIYFRGFGGFKGSNVKASWSKHLPGMDPAKYLHVLAMSSGVIDVSEDGTIAKGRWYGQGMVAMPAPHIGELAINHFAFTAVYENEYIKQNGVWKIQVLDVAMLCKVPKPGIVDPQRFQVVFLDPAADAGRPEFRAMFDFVDDTQTSYPSAFVLPFHFPHPVTGRVTTAHVP
jgi:SnoaL-like domain